MDHRLWSSSRVLLLIDELLTESLENHAGSYENYSFAMKQHRCFDAIIDIMMTNVMRGVIFGELVVSCLFSRAWLGMYEMHEIHKIHETN